MARSMAETLAATNRAFGRSDSPMLARASSLAPAVICSICELEADSVRNSTAASGPSSAPPSSPAVRASKRVSAFAASAASAAIWGETVTWRSEIIGGTDAEYGPWLRIRARLDIGGPSPGSAATQSTCSAPVAQGVGTWLVMHSPYPRLSN